MTEATLLASNAALQAARCDVRLCSKGEAFRARRDSGAQMSTIETPHSAISFAPPTQWHDHDHHGHVVQFYSDDDFLVDAISRFIGVTHTAGDAAVELATKSPCEPIT